MANLSLLSTDNAIRGEIVLPIPAASVSAAGAGIPRIVDATIEECSRLPEVAKHRQAAEKAKAIEGRIRECRDALLDLVSKQTELGAEQTVDDLVATSAAIRTRQAELDGLQATADQIAPIVRTLATLARDAVLNASQDALALHRCSLTGAANKAKERAAALLLPVAAQVDAIKTSPKAVAAVTAHAEAVRATAASKLLIGETSRIVNDILAGLNLDAGQP